MDLHDENLTFVLLHDRLQPYTGCSVNLNAWLSFNFQFEGDLIELVQYHRYEERKKRRLRRLRKRRQSSFRLKRSS